MKTPTKNKIFIVLSIILLLIFSTIIYLFKRGDNCLTQPPYFNCHTQNKFEKIEGELNNLSEQIENFNKPSVLNINESEIIFSFDHIKDEVGWTRIMKNNTIKNSLKLYTNQTDPIIAPLSENTLIISVPQWPQNLNLYNGPLSNYFLNFQTGQTIELITKGRLIAKSQDGQKIIFLESACDKEYIPEPSASCNNINLSLRVVDLTSDLNGIMINHYYAMNQWFEEGPPYANFLDFGQAVFSPDNTKLAIEIKIKLVDADNDISDEYWTLLVADTKTKDIIKKSDNLSENSYKHIFWLNSEDIFYW
jgi:hypothetical protein